ncbi:MAG TPA: hypothetical protein VJZ27_01690 [Aggregatilineales bacterium]|nr:hypothetical protein [Aggregatilineales bacterium]
MNSEFDPRLENDDNAEQKLYTEQNHEQANLQASVSRLSQRSEGTESDDYNHQISHRLRLVDHLLMSAPLVLPSAEFAERVIEAVRRYRAESFNRYTAFGMILGLGSAATVAISLMIAGILVIANIILNWTEVYQNLVLFAGLVVHEVTELFSGVNGSLPGSPVISVLTIASLPLFVVWLYIMRRLNTVEVNA